MDHPGRHQPWKSRPGSACAQARFVDGYATPRYLCRRPHDVVDAYYETLARPTVLPSYGSLGTRFVLPRLSLRVPEYSCLSLALAWRPYVDINTKRNLLLHGVCSIATAAALALLIAYNNASVRLLVRPGANPSHASYRLQAPEALYRLYCGADALDVQDLDCWSSCTSRSGTILIVDMEIGGTGPRRSIAGAPDCNAAPTPLSWM
jgi:hypothetical protein